METGLFHAHSGLAYLLLLTTTASVLVAVLTWLGGVRPGLLKVGKVFRILDAMLLGMTGLIGIVMWIIASWLGFTTWWLWASLVGYIAVTFVLSRGSKAAITALKDGKEGMKARWVASSVVTWLLVWGTFAGMHVFSAR